MRSLSLYLCLTALAFSIGGFAKTKRPPTLSRTRSNERAHNLNEAQEREIYAGILKAAPHAGHYAEDVWIVGPGDYWLYDGIPECGDHQINYIEGAANTIAAYGVSGEAGALRSILETAAKKAIEQGLAKTGGDLSAWLDKILGARRYANCAQLAVVIPADAVFGGNLFNAHDWEKAGVCAQGQDCIVGWARVEPPVVIPAGHETILTATFKNWSADRTRTVSMTTVYYYEEEFQKWRKQYEATMD